MKIKILRLLNYLACIYLAIPCSFGQTGWTKAKHIDRARTVNRQAAVPVARDLIICNARFTEAIPQQSMHRLLAFARTNKAGITNLSSNENNIIDNPVDHPLGGTASLEIALDIVESADSLTSADGVLAEFNDIYCSCVNPQDALKFTNTNETFGLVRNNFMLAIERRPSISKDDTLFLRLIRYAQKNYQFVFKSINLARPNLSAFLVDQYTGISTPIDISGNTTLGFSINSDTASNNKDRFMVVFDDATVLPVTFTGIKARLKGKYIAVEWKVGNQVNVHHYEVEKSADGIKFGKANNQPVAIATTYNWLDAQVFTGDNFYRVRSISDNGSIVYSKIVNVNTGKVSGGMRLLQNPVTSGAIDLYFSDMAAGKYQVRILNMQGQALFTKKLIRANGSAVEKIILPANFAKAVYNLEITGNGRQVTTLRLIND